MAKILIINPLVREEDDPKHIPYGLALLAQIAINNDHLVQLYDHNAWRKSDDTIKDIIKSDNWDVIAIGGLITTYASIKRICRLIKSVNPDTFIIAGGGFLTAMPHEMMGWIPEINLGVIGEGFVTWPIVLEKIQNNDFNFTETLGACYRDDLGESVLNPVRPNINDLDKLPYPAWDLLPLDIYFSNSSLLFSEQSYTATRRMDLNGSLGCSLHCKYCWHLGTTGDMIIEEDENGKNDVRFTQGRNIRYHSTSYIVNMVKELVKRYNVDFIMFIDENLMTMHQASRRTWLYELSELWIKEGLQPSCCRDGVKHDENCHGGVHWSGTGHAGLVDPDILDAMAKAGCAGLVYGLESFDKKILRKLGKGSSQKANVRSISMTQEAGIVPIPNMIVGFPEESFDSIRTTMEWMIKLGIHARPHFATPYPGSEWYYTYKDSIIEQYNGDLEAFILDLGDATKITATISHMFSGMQLTGLQDIIANRNFRLLDLAEKHWGGCNEHIQPLVKPQQSFNFLKKPTKAPIEPIDTI